ncbi:MAG: PqiA/YebS family transporter subunit [Desulfoprunum sp.]|nr:PqiA/YebS family transporter subunit [Desulfoprunum sp.]
MHDQIHTTACPECDLLLSFSETLANHSLCCPRCGCQVHKRISDWLEKTLVLSATGLLLYLPALLLPLMTLETLGMTDSGNVLDTILVFYKNGYFVVALVVLVSAVFLPLLLLSLIFTITLSLTLHRYSAFLLKLFRLYIFLEEWAMVEIYLLGIMVTIMKMRHTAEIHFNPGFFCFTALVLISMGISTFLDKEQIWSTIATKGGKRPSGDGLPTAAPENEHAAQPQTALRSGLVLCHTCRQLQPLQPGTAEPSVPCTRCGSLIHSRKPESISQTSALILTSAFLLIPANILPIMQVQFMGVPEYSTIVDGIRFFFQDGAYLIGLIILTASVLVPIFKIFGLVILLYTTRFQRNFYLREKAVLFRFISFIGRWSMLDIFVIALLTVLVNFGFFTSIHAAPAATYFCIVVTSTMFAATTFDPRLMWDSCRPDERSTDPAPPRVSPSSSIDPL